jgi:hypothetical protein
VLERHAGQDFFATERLRLEQSLPLDRMIWPEPVGAFDAGLSTPGPSTLGTAPSPIGPDHVRLSPMSCPASWPRDSGARIEVGPLSETATAQRSSGSRSPKISNSPSKAPMSIDRV